MLASSLLILLYASKTAQWDPRPGDPVVTVQVLDALGMPVAGAEVHVEVEPRWGWDGKSYEFVPTAHDFRTDDAGRFRFDPSVGVEYWIGIAPMGEPMALFELDRDDFRYPGGPVCRLRPVLTLRGRLLDAGGEPVVQRPVHLVPDELPQSFLAPVLPPGSILMECEDVGYAVAMRGPTGHPFERAILTTTTDESGRWSFRARAGEVAVTAADGDGVVQAKWRNLDQPEEDVTLHFQGLESGACAVCDADGEPIAGAVVYVARGAGWGDHSVLCPVGVTDEKGVARYTSLEGDMSGVAVRHPSYARWMVDDFHGERFEPGEPIAVPPPEEIGTIRLPVRDLEGNAVYAPRFRVLSWESELPGLPWLGTEERLHVIESRPVEPGVHEIVADATGLILVDSERHAPCAVIPMESELDDEEPVAVLHPGRRYSFRVFDGGKPVMGAVVAPQRKYDFDTMDEEEMQAHELCDFAMNVLWHDLLTSDDGQWSSPVVCSEMQLDFQIQHWDGRTETVLLPQDGPVDVEFGGPLVALTGRIVQDGVPLAGCELVVSEAWTDSASTEVRVPIGEDGEFTAKVHPGVALELSVDDHPPFRTSWSRVLEVPAAGDIGTIEVNDHRPQPVQTPARATVRFPTASDGVRPSVYLMVVAAAPADREACGEQWYCTLFVNDQGESGTYLPAGVLTVTLGWPGPWFRVPGQDYRTGSNSAASRQLRLAPGQVVDLTSTVEELIRELEGLKVE